MPLVYASYLTDRFHSRKHIGIWDEIPDTDMLILSRGTVHAHDLCHLRRVRFLLFEDCVFMDDVLTGLYQCLDLKILTLRRCSGRGLTRIHLKGLTKLHSLVFQDMTLPPQPMDWLDALLQLRTLQLGHVPWFQDHMITYLQKLTVLQVRSSSYFTGSTLYCTRALVSLDVSGCRHVTDRCLIHVPNLEALDVSSCPCVNGEGLWALSKLDTLLMRGHCGINTTILWFMPKVRIVDATDNLRIYDEDLKYFRHVRTLSLGHNHHLTGDGLDWCTQLEALVVPHCSNVDPVHLLHLPKLRLLDASFSRKVGIELLPFLPSIQFLHIHERVLGDLPTRELYPNGVIVERSYDFRKVPSCLTPSST